MGQSVSRERARPRNALARDISAVVGPARLEVGQMLLHQIV